MSVRPDAQRGRTLPELVVTLALLGIATVTVASYSFDWMARERCRGEAYKVLSFAQSARMEAVSRNHACLFVLDTSTRKVRVVDTRNTSDPSDDTVLSETALDRAISFESPVTGAPVTLAAGTGSAWYASFSPDGSVPVGAGTVSMRSGARHNRVSLFAAGGVKLEKWTGSSWVQGS